MNQQHWKGFAPVFVFIEFGFGWINTMKMNTNMVNSKPISTNVEVVDFVEHRFENYFHDVNVHAWEWDCNTNKEGNTFEVNVDGQGGRTREGSVEGQGGTSHEVNMGRQGVITYEGNVGEQRYSSSDSEAQYEVFVDSDYSLNKELVLGMNQHTGKPSQITQPGKLSKT